jgi:chromosome segregation ATPase
MKIFLILLVFPILVFSAFSQKESKEQLQDPIYLIKKYNQLAFQYNALVDKGRQNLNSQTPVITPARTIRVTNPVNEGLERSNSDLAYKLQSTQSELSQASNRKKIVEARLRFLEDENSQLKDKLREFRSSESDLEERSKRLVVENRRAKTDVKKFEILEKQLRADIRKLENSKTEAYQQLTDLEGDSKSKISNLRELNDELTRDNAMYKENQKVTASQTQDLKEDIRNLTNADVRNLAVVADMKEENEILRQENMQLAQRNKELDVAIQLMDQEIHEIAKMEQNLQTNLSIIDEENKTLVLTINNNRNDRNNLKEHIRELENKVAAFDRRNLELSGQLGMLRDNRVRLRNEIIDVIEQEDDRSDR